jgi:hypothetical protein
LKRNASKLTYPNPKGKSRCLKKKQKIKKIKTIFLKKKSQKKVLKLRFKTYSSKAQIEEADIAKKKES